MKVEFYKTNIGIIAKDDISIRLKSTYKKRILSDKEFINSGPVRINKNRYLEELNKYFKETKFEWEYNGTHFKKLDNFEIINTFKGIPLHDIGKPHLGKCMIVMYHGKLYYTFLSGSYYPQMQLVDFHTKELTNKWTNIRNLAPIFNKTTKKII
jgi:hypothetical protein